MTLFGTSAKFIDALREGRARAARARIGLDTRADHARPPARRSSPESFDFVYEHVKRDVHLASISGGTDIVALLRRSATRPARCGAARSSAAALGMAVEVFDDDGQTGAPARRASWSAPTPFPSMPLGFWNDPDGAQVPRGLLRDASRASGATATTSS